MDFWQEEWAYRRGIEILACRFGLASNRPELLPLLPFPLDVPSLLTDFYQVVEIPWPEEKADAYIFIQEAPEMSPQWTRENNN